MSDELVKKEAAIVDDDVEQQQSFENLTNADMPYFLPLFGIGYVRECSVCHLTYSDLDDNHFDVCGKCGFRVCQKRDMCHFAHESTKDLHDKFCATIGHENAGRYYHQVFADLRAALDKKATNNSTMMVAGISKFVATFYAKTGERISDDLIHLFTLPGRFNAFADSCPMLGNTGRRAEFTIAQYVATELDKVTATMFYEDTLKLLLGCLIVDAVQQHICIPHFIMMLDESMGYFYLLMSSIDSKNRGMEIPEISHGFIDTPYMHHRIIPCQKPPAPSKKSDETPLSEPVPAKEKEGEEATVADDTVTPPPATDSQEDKKEEHNMIIRGVPFIVPPEQHTNPGYMVRIFDTVYGLASDKRTQFPVNMVFYIDLCHLDPNEACVHAILANKTLSRSARKELIGQNKRLASTSMLIRLMGTRDDPSICVVQQHSTFYSVSDWLSGYLFTRPDVKAIKKQPPSEIPDFFNVNVTDPTKLSAQRIAHLVKEPVFAGGARKRISGMSEVHRLAAWLDTLATSSSSTERTAVYADLTGVKWPTRLGRFQLSIYQANLAC